MKDKRIYWVALNLVLSEHLKLGRRVLDRFPSLTDAFEAPKQEFLSLGFDEVKTEAITSPVLLDRASRIIEATDKKGYSVLTIDGDGYPELLKEIFDPPLVLYCAGKSGVLNEATVAIVGARKPTPYGRAVTEKLSEDLASRGVVVVSGMARGIDSMAHTGALRGGKTVAVLGSGLENIYPRENRRLFDKIVETGAVLTEFPPDSPPLSLHFPLRNRIISGLSLALVVVEASRRSGSLISARLALEQNRDVMAVPGNITSTLSQGTNWLIKTGAKPVESWEDVAEELPTPWREKLLSQKEEEKARPEMSDPEEEILGRLRPDELTHIDELVDQTAFSVSELLVLLLSLELKGLIFQSPGKFFQRRM